MTPPTLPQLSTLQLLLKLWHKISIRRRLQLFALLLVMLFSGFAELLSLGAVLPFLTVLSDPELLWENHYSAFLISRLGITQSSQLILPVTLGFSFVAVIAAFIRLANLWFNVRLSASIGSDISCEAYSRTLYQPYTVHVQRNSATVITATTSYTGATVGVISSLLQLITSLIVSIGLLTGLILINSTVAFGSIFLFSLVYLIIAVTTRSKLKSNSRRISDAVRNQMQALQEGLGSIRDVLLDGNQPSYVDIYRRSDFPQRSLSAENQFLTTFPRFAIEALGLVAIAIFGGSVVYFNASKVSVIPLLGTLALGAQRLLPAFQQIYGGWATLKANNAALSSVLDMLSQPIPLTIQPVERTPLTHSISLTDVDFRYTLDDSLVLSGINLTINRGERIGFIGTTGSGKSTLVDIIMGLLPPTSGSIHVDGLNLYDVEYPSRLFGWRSNIAHVPQTIYLADSSFAENIAYGVPRDTIDMERIKSSALKAQISDFIESTPLGYDTFVGERGVRLSGGQRQRIGIARALYKQASVLIFDEATSALDVTTELSVMNSINSLSRNLTLLIIAHRVSTVQSCDRVYELCSGQIKRETPGSQLITIQS